MWISVSKVTESLIPERRLLNTDKIRTRTSWKPIITLDEGLTMCVNSIKK